MEIPTHLEISGMDIELIPTSTMRGDMDLQFVIRTDSISRITRESVLCGSNELLELQILHAIDNISRQLKEYVERRSMELQNGKNK